MNRYSVIVVAMMLAASLAFAQQPQQPPPQQQQPAGQQPAAQQPAEGAQAPARKQPQAKTKEEFDALQKMGDPNLPPDERIRQAEEFLIRYPDSELKVFAYRQEMQAYQQKNDFTNMLEFGEKVLHEEPDDAITLIMLASAIPERTRENDMDRDQKLKKAEEFSNRALGAIEKLEKPAQLTDADFERAKNDARGQVHAALGFVNIHRKNFDAAVASFKKAVELQSQKDPIVYWRLGLAYSGAKKYEEARDAYKQAMDLGGVKIGERDLAAEEFRRVDEFIKKRGAAAPQQ